MEKKENLFIRILKAIGGFFANIGISIGRFFKNLGLGIARFFVDFFKRFKNGSIGTKISYLIMGFGNVWNRQYIKGILYFVIQVLYILFMVLCPKVNNTPFGYKALVNFGTLGTNEGDIDTVADDSRLMLLFGVLTIGITIMFLYAWISNTKSSYKADCDKREGNKPTSFVEDLKALLDSRFHVAMLTPTVIFATIFTLLPTIYMICIAFTDWGVNNPNNSFFKWSGFENFQNIFSGTGEISKFPSVLLWTFIWAIFATFLNYFGGILVALLINKKEIKFKKFWRTIFIMTIALPQFISLLAMRKILSTEGPVNTLLMNLHIIKEPIAFLEGAGVKTWVARIMVIVINLWIGIPYTMLMTTGILMNIPADLYEAATIDGANKRQMFFKITLPYIIFITSPYLISSFIGNITSFNIIYLLTGGGPQITGYQVGGTDLLVTWLFKLTIDQRDYNTGSVIGIMTFLITAILTLAFYTNSKAYKQEDTFQ